MAIPQSEYWTTPSFHLQRWSRCKLCHGLFFFSPLESSRFRDFGSFERLLYIIILRRGGGRWLSDIRADGTPLPRGGGAFGSPIVYFSHFSVEGGIPIHPTIHPTILRSSKQYWLTRLLESPSLIPNKIGDRSEIDSLECLDHKRLAEVWTPCANTRAAVRIGTVKYHDSVGRTPANEVAAWELPRIFSRRSSTTAFPAGRRASGAPSIHVE